VFYKTVLSVMSDLLLILLILAGVGLSLAAWRRRRGDRVFVERWSQPLADAEEDYKRLCDAESVFSDAAKKAFLQKYAKLHEACSNLPRAGAQERMEHLTPFRVFKEKYESIDAAQARTNIQYFTDKTSSLPADYTGIRPSSRYVGYHEVEAFKKKWGDTLKQFSELENREKYRDIPTFATLVEVSSLFDELHERRSSANESYMAMELDRNAAFFDSLFRYALDAQQRKAIVTEEDNTLVISSAGSGKTSTVIGKVHYLIRQLGVLPEEIAVLTFSRKAAEELRARMGVDGVLCSTFHKHALDTIGMLTNEKPSVLDNAETLIPEIIKALLEDDDAFLRAVNRYHTDMTVGVKDDDEYQSLAEKRADVRKYGLRCPYADMDGKAITLKSRQELQIAVILTELGVTFRYEEPYEYNTATAGHKQYQPDFTIHYKLQKEDSHGKEYVARKTLYLEHFGIDAKGNVPRWFGDGKPGGWAGANKSYNDGIAWKKETHRRYNTKLVITTSADFQRESDIASYIENLLHRAGVPIRPLSEAEKRQKLLTADPNADDRLGRVASTFIKLMKANDKTIKGVCSIIPTYDASSRRDRFVLTEIVSPIYARYQETLKSKRMCDYTDLILKATSLCRQHNPYRYKYIIVDEFQDMSMDRCRYIEALRSNSPYTRLFCVGDDWQSIYRFSGSDMTLFYDFDRHFGYTAECRIETTHRFGHPLLGASTRFILKNPEQKVKDVRAPAGVVTNLQVIPFPPGNEPMVLERLVREIPATESVLVIGRYAFTVQSVDSFQNNNKAVAWKGTSLLVAGRELAYLTVHSAKGLEADHVIILDCNGGRYGFPSQVEDDPIMQHVLSAADSFENAEERRLFYVAITRAKKGTYCLYDEKNPSEFVAEFPEFRRNIL